MRRSAAATTIEPPPAWLTALVAKRLSVPPSELDDTAPLAEYGLDSLAAVEIAAEIGERLGTEVPETLLYECRDLVSLGRFVRTGQSAESRRAGRDDFDVERESRLPDDLRPAGPRSAPTTIDDLLLTGATGFLGGFLVTELLARGLRVRCLVRAADADSGRRRLEEQLERAGLSLEATADRLRVVTGDVSRPRWGLEPRAWQELAEEVDAVLHVAATVSWVGSYESLRDANVGGAREALRLAAAGRPKSLHLVSSLGVCYSRAAKGVLDETADVARHARGLHLGYMRSKLVAEEMLRRATERGVTARVYRPALLTGDTRRGHSNLDDVLARLLKACIEMRAAPDLDWNVDACPVDFAASAIAEAVVGGVGGRDPVHLAAPRPRAWREIVLWLNLRGYPVELVPFETWRRRVDDEARRVDHPLHPLRAFFTTRRPELDDHTIAELFESGRTSRAGHDASRARLERSGHVCPGLDAEQLDLQFRSFVARGYLTDARHRSGVSPGSLRPPFDAAGMETLLVRAGWTDTRVSRIRRIEQDSILTELTSWRGGRRDGLYRCQIARSGSDPFDAVVKIKPRDREVLDVITDVAEVCDPELGAAFDRHRDRLELRGSRTRELELYDLAEAAFPDLTPGLYAAIREPDCHALTLEDVGGAGFRAPSPGKWDRTSIRTVLEGIARVHAAGVDIAAERAPSLRPIPGAEDLLRMTDLWTALARFSRRYFESWCGPELARIQDELIETAPADRRSLNVVPFTLIHHDFHPRNVTLRASGQGERLCVFDWELAALGPPERDVAEFLCFALPTGADPGDQLDHYRCALARASGHLVDRETSELAWRWSLRDLMLRRLPLYAIVHHFQRQPYLERAVRNWWRLAAAYRIQANRLP